MKSVYSIYDDLKTEAKLYYPNLNDPFYIDTDACDTGIGAILYQKGGIIALYSKKLNLAQSNYSIVEKEMFAIFSAISHWRSWLGGAQITIRTDSKNLLGNTGKYDKKTERWKAILGEFNIHYVHIDGSTNVIADNLSRTTSETKPVVQCANINENLTAAGPDTFDRYARKFHIVHGHPGISCTIKTMLKTHSLTTDQRRHIMEQIRTCRHCQICKFPLYKHGTLKGVVTTETPLTDISSDVFGPFPVSDYIHNSGKSQMYAITFSDRC